MPRIRKLLSLSLALTVLSAAAVKTAGFVFYPVGNGVLKWNVNAPGLSTNVVNPVTKAIRYYIASDAYSSANREKEINAVRASFDQWQSISGSGVKFEFAGLVSPENLDTRNDHQNVVFWAKNTLLVNNGTENLSQRRAWTAVQFAADGSIVDADIVLNGKEFQWFTDFNDTVNQAQFIEAIVLHEIGHMLGLDHSPAGGATVKDGGNGINTNAGLSADEIAAARFLYGTTSWAGIEGTVRMNGNGILGAVVAAQDSLGNIAGVTVTQASGKFGIYGLSAGTYTLWAMPLDPANSGRNSLMRPSEVAVDYANATTAFRPSAEVTVNLASGQMRSQDFSVPAGNPPYRVTSISKPSTIESLLSTVRYAVSVTQGQSNLFLAVSSPAFSAGLKLNVTGNGLTVGPTTFVENGIAQGIHSLRIPVSVSSNATPGLRTFVVTGQGSAAYAPGYLEIRSAVPDYNFDGLDDRFQRANWPLWTNPNAAPAADPDNDGFSNRYEFRVNSNPLDPGSNRLALNSILQDRFGTRLTWMADSGAVYRLWSKASLGSDEWSLFLGPINATTEVVSTPVTFSGPGRYFRLELVR